MQFFFGSREEAVGVARRGEGSRATTDLAATSTTSVGAAQARAARGFFDTVGEIDIRQVLAGSRCRRCSSTDRGGDLPDRRGAVHGRADPGARCSSCPAS